MGYAEQMFEQMGGSVEVEITELVSQKVFNEVCAKTSRCTIAFLPDIRDTGKADREALIEDLKAVQKSYRRSPVLWAAAGTQPAWEEQFRLVGTGFPAVVKIRTGKNADDKIGVKHTGKFTVADLSSFVTKAWRQSEFIKGWPAVEAATPWDGEEPAPI